MLPRGRPPYARALRPVIVTTENRGDFRRFPQGEGASPQVSLGGECSRFGSSPPRLTGKPLRAEIMVELFIRRAFVGPSPSRASYPIHLSPGQGSPRRMGWPNRENAALPPHAGLREPARSSSPALVRHGLAAGTPRRAPGHARSVPVAPFRVTRDRTLIHRVECQFLYIFHVLDCQAPVNTGRASLLASSAKGRHRLLSADGSGRGDPSPTAGRFLGE